MPEWQHIIDDLTDLSTMEVEQDGRWRCSTRHHRPDLPSTRTCLANRVARDAASQETRRNPVVPKNPTY